MGAPFERGIVRVQAVAIGAVSYLLRCTTTCRGARKQQQACFSHQHVLRLAIPNFEMAVHSMCAERLIAGRNVFRCELSETRAPFEWGVELAKPLRCGYLFQAGALLCLPPCNESYEPWPD